MILVLRLLYDYYTLIMIYQLLTGWTLFKLTLTSVGRQFEEVVRATQKQHKGDLPEKDSEILKNSNNNSWSRLKNKIDVIKNMRKSEPIDTGRIIDEVLIKF